jgi:anti-sigma factor RsiW
MTCEQAVSLVTDYLDGGLTVVDAARFEAHLAECPHCAEHLAQMRITIAATGQLRLDDVDPSAREDLLRLYRSWSVDSAG